VAAVMVGLVMRSIMSESVEFSCVVIVAIVTVF